MKLTKIIALTLFMNLTASLFGAVGGDDVDAELAGIFTPVGEKDGGSCSSLFLPDPRGESANSIRGQTPSPMFYVIPVRISHLLLQDRDQLSVLEEVIFHSRVLFYNHEDYTDLGFKKLVHRYPWVFTHPLLPGLVIKTNQPLEQMEKRIVNAKAVNKVIRENRLERYLDYCPKKYLYFHKCNHVKDCKKQSLVVEEEKPNLGESESQRFFENTIGKKQLAALAILFEKSRIADIKPGNLLVMLDHRLVIVDTERMHVDNRDAYDSKFKDVYKWLSKSNREIWRQIYERIRGNSPNLEKVKLWIYSEDGTTWEDLYASMATE